MSVVLLRSVVVVSCDGAVMCVVKWRDRCHENKIIVVADALADCTSCVYKEKSSEPNLNVSDLSIDALRWSNKGKKYLSRLLSV